MRRTSLETRAGTFLSWLLIWGSVGCGDAAVAPAAKPAPRPWNRLATPTAGLPAVRGLRPARGIVHAHSPYSHDACDGEGLDAAGLPNPGCAADLRRGICEAAEDFVMITDHPAYMADQSFEDLLFLDDDDEPIVGQLGDVTAKRLGCQDDRRVLFMTGTEDRVMAVGLERHVPGTAEERAALYGRDDGEALAAMRDAGALVAIAHTESRTPEYLDATPFDTMEVYNLHAALDPDIRKDFLGVDPFAAAAALLPFLQLADDTPEPDLAFLAFFEELPLYTERLDGVLAKRRVAATAGTDVHQNTFASALRDGERGDSYRRLMRWLSNVVLIDGDLTPASVKAALQAGRGYVTFEILGVPSGFDFHAAAGDRIYEMGEAASGGATLLATAPVLLDPDPAVAAPDVTMRLLRVTAAGSTPVGEGLRIELDAAPPGAYRVEVRITPHHLVPYLGSEPGGYLHAFPWILSNAIYVE